MKKLLAVLYKLVNAGNTLVVVEHNLEVIKSADWVSDFGSESGAAGGRIIAEGGPEQVAKTGNSHTGPFLAQALAGNETRRFTKSPNLLFHVHLLSDSKLDEG